MSHARTAVLTSLAMTAFAGNSLLCRAALDHTGIDAASFTTVRLVSGASILALIVLLKHRAPVLRGSWPSALALFAYAAGFSFAYISLPAATGALLLFGAVQATMIIAGLVLGERLKPLQSAGLALAIAGLVAMMLPGVTAPSLSGAILMVAAGIAWGVYSLLGRGSSSALQTTTGNFLRATMLGAVLAAVAASRLSWDPAGAAYAVLSGAVASGMGYAIWYTVLPLLQATQAATVQLSVPVIAAIGGAVLLGEQPTLRLALCSLAILGGIALVLRARASAPRPAR